MSIDGIKANDMATFINVLSIILKHGAIVDCLFFHSFDEILLDNNYPSKMPRIPKLTSFTFHLKNYRNFFQRKVFQLSP